MDHRKHLQIQNKIEEARNAIQVWNDRRSEVMIELDSIFMEIEEFKNQMAAEKAEKDQLVSELKMALEKSETNYHRHFEIYTNDMQELKVTNESLQDQLNQAAAGNESLRREMRKMESDFQARVAKLNSDAELKQTEYQLQAKTQITTLNQEVVHLKTENQNLQNRAQQYEKELRLIRNQMMNFLNVTQSVSAGAESAAPIMMSSAIFSNEPKIGNLTGSHAAVSSKDEELAATDMSLNPPSTVDEYLKRFGY
jgi:chromosome segregation ATPase